MIRAFLFFIFSTSVLFAQHHQLSGKVVNQENSPLSFVNALLLTQADSTFVSGTATDNSGMFTLSGIAEGNYILKASFIGYQDFYQNVELTGDLDIRTIILAESSESLDEVALSIERPTVQREIDRLIFHVENTSLSNGSTMDILNRTPSVIVQQGSITVQNQPATIYINDRKVNISPAETQSLLEGFAGSNIKSVEVITNPPARYDADSGLIINIVTSKVIIPGYKGSVSGGFEQAVFPKYRAGTSHYFKNDRLNLFVGYNINKRKEHKNDLGAVTFFEPDNSINSFWETDFERITRSKTHNINSFLDFALSEKTTLSMSSLVFIEPNTTYSNSETAEVFNPQMQLDSLFVTTSSLSYDKHNLAFDLSLDHKFNENGTRLHVNTHYTNFEHSRLQHVNTDYLLPDGGFLANNRFSTDANQEISIYVGQIDFESSLWGISLETGAKASVIESESGISFFDITNGSTALNTAFSDNFLYNETVFAGYLNMSKRWEKWHLRLGLRGEYTETKGNSVALNQVNRNDYFDLFPNVILNYTPNHNHSITLAHNSSIRRPEYSMLNPFSYFINENNFTTGDPDLKPAITNRYSVSYLVENKYSFEFYYRTTQGTVDVLSFQNNENRFLRSISTNMKNKSGYGFVFSYFTPIRDWWSFSHYSSLFLEKNSFYAIESGNELVTISSNGLLLSLNNNFRLTKDGTFTANASLIHLSGLVSGTYLMDDFTTASLSIRKSLWNNRAVLSLTANDIFNTTNRKLQTNYLNQHNSYYAKIESRYALLGFVYNFGNFRLRDNTRQIRNEERNRI